VVLVSNTPALLTILVYFVFEEKTIPLSLAGIFVVLGGTAVVAQDGSAGSVAVLSNAMTILSAVTFTVYVLIGRSQRSAAQPVGVPPYSIVL
jgi:drug/metabolite transporter (DMT)-like permease